LYRKCIKRVAEMFKLSHFTIFRYVEKKKIKAVKFGKQWYIPRKEIEKLYGGEI